MTTTTVSYNPQFVIDGLTQGHGDDVGSATSISEAASEALKAFCESNGYEFEEGSHPQTVRVTSDTDDPRGEDHITDLCDAIVQRCVENG